MGMRQFELVHPAEVQIWLELLFGDTPLPTGELHNDLEMLAANARCYL
jgi:hypothetical protein